MRVVHGDIVDNSAETLTMHGAFVGACVMGGIGAAQELNAKLQKQLAKQKEVLDAAERAEQASKAVAAAKEQSAATETQLKEIETSLKGAMSGTFVGHEKIMPISEVVANALDKAGKKDAAGKLYGKIRAEQALDKDELKQARQIANLIGPDAVSVSILLSIRIPLSSPITAAEASLLAYLTFLPNYRCNRILRISFRSLSLPLQP